tara:strand:- start:97 stop:771 length:675 start_codon:yes stop_codon:yes gene_type:complete
MEQYSWENFSKQFSHLSGVIGIYDFTLTEIESTDPIEKSFRSYTDVFNNQDQKVSYLIKISDTTASISESKLMKFVSPITQNRVNVERCMLRIQTNPWRHSCHFDTYDQTVIMLDGVKKWLLFRLVYSDIKEERQFIQKVNGLAFEKLEELLKSMKVVYIVKTSKPGDEFFIPAGMYHAVENENYGKGTIFVNVVHNGFSEILDKRFTQIWPTMAQKCENQVFY